MREIRPSGSEGGVRSIPHPYPYRGGGSVKHAPPANSCGHFPFRLAAARSLICLYVASASSGQAFRYMSYLR